MPHRGGPLQPGGRRSEMGGAGSARGRGGAVRRVVGWGCAARGGVAVGGGGGGGGVGPWVGSRAFPMLPLPLSLAFAGLARPCAPFPRCPGGCETLRRRPARTLGWRGRRRGSPPPPRALPARRAGTHPRCLPARPIRGMQWGGSWGLLGEWQAQGQTTRASRGGRAADTAPKRARHRSRKPIEQSQAACPGPMHAGGAVQRRGQGSARAVAGARKVGGRCRPAPPIPAQTLPLPALCLRTNRPRRAREHTHVFEQRGSVTLAVPARQGDARAAKTHSASAASALRLRRGGALAKHTTWHAGAAACA